MIYDLPWKVCYIDSLRFLDLLIILETSQMHVQVAKIKLEQLFFSVIVIIVILL